MGIFIFSYHVDNEPKIKELGDDYAQYHDKIINMERTDPEYASLAQQCERILRELRKLIIRSEVIYKKEQDQLNKSIQVAMRAQEIINKNKSENDENSETDNMMEAEEIMREMEENPDMFKDIIGEMDESYDISKLKSGFNKVMDLMQEISKDENLRIGMFNIPD